MSLPRSTKGFTLIEVMIVIAIVAILLIGTYIPYQRFSLAAQIQETSQKFDQMQKTARTYSVNGFVFLSGGSQADTDRVSSDMILHIEATTDVQPGSVSLYSVHYRNQAPKFEELSPILKEAHLVSSLTLPKDVAVFLASGKEVTLYWTAPNGNLTKFVDGAVSSGSLSTGFGLKTSSEVDRKTITIR